MNRFGSRSESSFFKRRALPPFPSHVGVTARYRRQAGLIFSFPSPSQSRREKKFAVSAGRDRPVSSFFFFPFPCSGKDKVPRRKRAPAIPLSLPPVRENSEAARFLSFSFPHPRGRHARQGGISPSLPPFFPSFLDYPKRGGRKTERMCAFPFPLFFSLRRSR